MCKFDVMWCDVGRVGGVYERVVLWQENGQKGEEEEERTGGGNCEELKYEDIEKKSKKKWRKFSAEQRLFFQSSILVY